MTTNAKPEQLFDTRLIDRHLNAGKVNKKEYDQYLRSLPDNAENIEVIPKDVLFEDPDEDAAE